MAAGLVRAEEPAPVQFTPEEINQLMALGTVGIMEKVYKEGVVKEVIDLDNVYGKKAFVFYYDLNGEDEDVQKRLAIITYGLGSDKRLKDIRFFGCDISQQPGYRVIDDYNVTSNGDVRKHGITNLPSGALFDIASNIPVQVFRVGPATNGGINIFQEKVYELIYSNLIKPLRDDGGEYVYSVEDQKDLKKKYINDK